MLSVAYRFFTVFILLGVAMPAHAYVGPGAGLGAIAAVVALILGVVLLVVGFLWYPLKRLLRGSKKSVPADDAKSENQ